VRILTRNAYLMLCKYAAAGLQTSKIVVGADAEGEVINRNHSVFTIGPRGFGCSGNSADGTLERH
jgi:hypothetical protein